MANGLFQVPMVILASQQGVRDQPLRSMLRQQQGRVEQRLNSVVGRIGVRFVQSWGMAAPLSGEPGSFTAWVRSNFWYEFLGNPKAAFSSPTGFIPFEADMFGPTLEINTGMTAELNATTAVYANASYLVGLGGSADGNAYDGKVGSKFAW